MEWLQLYLLHRIKKDGKMQDISIYSILVEEQRYVYDFYTLTVCLKMYYTSRQNTTNMFL